MDLYRPLAVSEPVTQHVTHRSDLLAVIGAGLLWGTGGLAGVLLGRWSGADPLAVAAYRLLVGGGLVVAGLLLLGRHAELRLGRSAWRRVVVVGLLAATYQGCYFAAVELTSVSVATLVTLGSSPLLVVSAEAALTRRRPDPRVLTALAVATVGLVLLVGGPSDTAPVAVVLGALLALGSAAGFAAITLLGARPVAGLGPFATTGLSFSVGGLVLVPLALVAGQVSVGLEPASLSLVVYLGVAPTALAYMLYFSGLRSVRPGPAALIAMLEPLTAAVLGAVLLHERLGPTGIAGGILIGAAVVICRRG